MEELVETMTVLKTERLECDIEPLCAVRSLGDDAYSHERAKTVAITLIPNFVAEARYLVQFHLNGSPQGYRIA